MKIAVGLMAIGLSLLVLFQSLIMMGMIGPDYLELDQKTLDMGVMYFLLAIILFIGAAFSFALPTVAIIVFALGFLHSRTLEEPTDIRVWGIGSLLFGFLLVAEAVGQRRKRPSAAEQGSME